MTTRLRILVATAGLYVLVVAALAVWYATRQSGSATVQAREAAAPGGAAKADTPDRKEDTVIATAPSPAVVADAKPLALSTAVKNLSTGEQKPNGVLELVVEAGETVRTPCVEFSVNAKSRVGGKGCYLYVRHWAPKGGYGPIYMTVNARTVAANESTLDAAVRLVRDDVAALDKKLREQDAARSPSPVAAGGPYDIRSGKYLGEEAGKFAGLEARLLRWGKTIGAFDSLCPNDHPRSKAAALKNYEYVEARTVVLLPKVTLGDGGTSAAYVTVWGPEKGCESTNFNYAYDSLKLLLS